MGNATFKNYRVMLRVSTFRKKRHRAPVLLGFGSDAGASLDVGAAGAVVGLAVFVLSSVLAAAAATAAAAPSAGAGPAPLALLVPGERIALKLFADIVVVLS